MRAADQCEVFADQIGFYYPGKESKFDEEVIKWRKFAQSGILTVRGKILGGFWVRQAGPWSSETCAFFDQPVVLQADNPYDTMVENDRGFLWKDL